MMYNEKLAVAVKVNGKVLREFKDQVYIPFGSEYSVFIKNLNTVRALVTISIDGEDIADGSRFVVQPNESIDIERFLRNGNNNAGNRFKFIERTTAVEDHRGIQIEDGIVRVEYQFEKQNQNFLNYPPGIRGPLRGRGFDVSYSSATYSTAGTVHDGSATMDAGITVEGSISDQQFQTTSSFPVETTRHVIVMKLLGETEEAVVVKPVTVKAKPTCKTCGKVNKATSKFCGECGTSLQIVA